MTIKAKLASLWPFPVRARINGGGEMFVDLRSAIGRGIRRTGTFDPAVLDAITEHVSGKLGFIDVGSNVGFYSFSAVSKLDRAGAVWAFEIDPRPLRCFKKTLSRFPGYDRVNIVECALGAREGSADLDSKTDCGHSQIIMRDPSASSSSKQVPVTTLSNWYAKNGRPKIDLIKIDVEGFEGLVLEGADLLLAEQKPALILEVDDNLLARVGWDGLRIRTLVQSLGYQVSTLSGAHSPTWVALQK